MKFKYFSNVNFPLYMPSFIKVSKNQKYGSLNNTFILKIVKLDKLELFDKFEKIDNFDIWKT